MNTNAFTAWTASIGSSASAMGRAAMASFSTTRPQATQTTQSTQTTQTTQMTQTTQTKTPSDTTDLQLQLDTANARLEAYKLQCDKFIKNLEEENSNLQEEYDKFKNTYEALRLQHEDSLEVNLRLREDFEDALDAKDKIMKDSQKRQNEIEILKRENRTIKELMKKDDTYRIFKIIDLKEEIRKLKEINERPPVGISNWVLDFRGLLTLVVNSRAMDEWDFGGNTPKILFEAITRTACGVLNVDLVDLRCNNCGIVANSDFDIDHHLSHCLTERTVKLPSPTGIKFVNRGLFSHEPLKGCSVNVNVARDVYPKFEPETFFKASFNMCKPSLKIEPPIELSKGLETENKALSTIEEIDSTVEPNNTSDDSDHASDDGSPDPRPEDTKLESSEYETLDQTVQDPTTKDPETAIPDPDSKNFGDEFSDPDSKKSDDEASTITNGTAASDLELPNRIVFDPKDRPRYFGLSRVVKFDPVDYDIKLKQVLTQDLEASVGVKFKVLVIDFKQDRTVG